MDEQQVKKLLATTKDRMEKAIKHLDSALLTLRAGKADPNLLNGIMVDYYGASTPLAQVASISTPDARTIAVQPWEKSTLGAIEKAILIANIGLTPGNNGELIRLNVPPLTEERRKDLVKQVKTEAEHAKVSIRNARRDALEELKKFKKDGLAEDAEKKAETEAQHLTDSHIKKIDEICAKKEKDIMTV